MLDRFQLSKIVGNRGLVYRLIAIAFVCCFACRSSSQQPPGTRVVTLSPSATEVVHALGETANLVGVDRYSKFPPQVAGLPVVGDFLNPNVEAILRLRPTLVVLDDIHNNLGETLRGAGIATAACSLHRLADIEGAMVSVGAQLGKQQQAALAVKQLQEVLERARKQPRRGVRVLAIIDRTPGAAAGLVAAGKGAWLDELLEVAGWQNALAETVTRYPKVSLEEVLRSAPTIILDLSQADSSTAAAAIWKQALGSHPAEVKVSNAATLTAPTPRLSAALEDLAAALQASDQGR